MEFKACPHCGKRPQINSSIVDFSFDYYELRHHCTNSSVSVGSRGLFALYTWWERRCENAEE